MGTPSEAEELIKQLIAGNTPEQNLALINALMQAQQEKIFEALETNPDPTVAAAPEKVRGLRIRIDLAGTKPPVWRRLDLPGDLRLPTLHAAIQATMGWTDSHLHRFRTGREHRSPYFVTQYDVDEGEDGVLEDEIRLDQLLFAEGDCLWYEYDFGDGWEHVLRVEAVLNEVPAPTCLAGRRACPPEDCGGPHGYQGLAGWVRSGYADDQLPDHVEDAAFLRDWLPLGWHPDRFDAAEATTALADALAEPAPVAGELAELADDLQRRGITSLRRLLAQPASHQPAAVTDEEAAGLTEAYDILLDVLGDGVALTSAGYLPPRLVQEFSARSGVSQWWIGRANREDLTPPVAKVRETARALGLIHPRKGRLNPTSAGARCHGNPQLLWRHIVDRLPLGAKGFDRQAGWITLAVVGSGVPQEAWHHTVLELMRDLGWRSGLDELGFAYNPTLDVFDQLAGAPRRGWNRDGATAPAIAATARAAIRES